ncbi:MULTISPECIES: DUF2231 domain-containing protein [unclassified Legionella]|uniref:DUF2231 domain-containing protein n=1 Tax=unclassified Legionella TaxID=2622702 RepID=UPI001054DF04|nr:MULTISPECIES: DUF2231 domain-containing protein [unclassified Legionella]MDI9817587.1 DUF2231 domain-containing protein [Legionella sp. PL877]
MAHEPINSRMSIAGHPIHPMLIHFPVAALLGLVATDVAYIYSHDLFWARAGLWLVGVGTVGGAFSGIIGLIDLITVARIRNLITAWCHAILAVMMLSVSSFNWLLRLDDFASHILPIGVYTSLLTALLIFLTSIFGGQLVYEYGVGVDIES